MGKIIKNGIEYVGGGGSSADVQELENNLTASDNTMFRFGVTEDGQYGYIITDEAGADTVVPFKTGGGGGAEIVTVQGEVISYPKQVTKTETITIPDKTILGVRKVTYTSNGADFASWMKCHLELATFNVGGSATFTHYHSNQYGTNPVQATYELVVNAKNSKYAQDYLYRQTYTHNMTVSWNMLTDELFVIDVSDYNYICIENYYVKNGARTTDLCFVDEDGNELAKYTQSKDADINSFDNIVVGVKDCNTVTMKLTYYDSNASGHYITLKNIWLTNE